MSTTPAPQRPIDSQTPVSGHQPTRALTQELRQLNGELIRRSSRSVLFTSILVLILLASLASHYIMHQYAISSIYISLLTVVATVLCGSLSLHSLIEFDAVNKQALPVFESLTDYLQRKESARPKKSRSRKSRPFPASEDQPQVPAAATLESQAEQVYPTSMLYTKVAVKEYIAARKMPFVTAPRGPQFYLLTNFLLSLMCLGSTLLARGN